MLPRDAEDWRRVLAEVGVEPEIATDRAPSFAATIREDSFSAGVAKELPDFLATILHESQMLTRLKENGNYSARRIRELSTSAAPGTRWRSLLTRAEKLAGKPDLFFEAIYGGRMGNGPEGTGDGARYPGRAYIGLTGLDNYRWLTNAMGLNDLVANPELAEQPIFALEFSLAWWEGKVPDSALGDERRVRRIINGGDYGLAECERLHKLVMAVLAA